MNTMHLAAHRYAAQGLGELGFDWDSLIQGGFNFGNRFLQAYENRGVARSGINPYGTTGGGINYATDPNLLALIQQQQLAANPNAYATGAITSEGIRVGNSVVSWPVLGLGVAAIFLLQSKGFSRR